MSGRGRGGGGRGAYYKARYGNGGRGGRGGGGGSQIIANDAAFESSRQSSGQSHNWDQLESTLVNIDGAQYGKSSHGTFISVTTMVYTHLFHHYHVAFGVDNIIQDHTNDC